jgi:hypothetical protein
MLAISSSRSSVVIVWGWVGFIIGHHFRFRFDANNFEIMTLVSAWCPVGA